ncbi:MAG: hypothetical protein VXV85_07540, partial [Candidatus Thermoplasmatota archaeon]|nr:hypothetical protein [Candidatus Thermoplasmatota archaeon]
DVEATGDPITNATNADSDGDGICDGPSAPALPADVCTAGPDAFPNDAAASQDTDGDGVPDELVEGIETDLVADTDDDGDDWSDEDEALCGTSSTDASSTPIDGDGDGICDIVDTDDDGDDWSDQDEAVCGTNSKEGTSIPFDGDDDGICDALDTKTLGYSNNGTAGDVFEAVLNQSDFIIEPDLSGMEPGTWSIYPALPAGLEFNGTMSRSGESGIISGVPTETSPMTEYTVFANNSQTGVQFTFSMAILEDTDGDGLPDGWEARGACTWDVSRVGINPLNGSDAFENPDGDGYDINHN